MIDPQGNTVESNGHVARRVAGDGADLGLRAPDGRASPYPLVATSRPRTREEVLRLWLALLVVCLLGAAFYYGLGRLLIAAGIF